jgi:uncharacterized protein
MTENTAEPIASFKSPTDRSPYSDPFWAGLARQVFVVQQCRSCGHITHPPGPVCTNCLSPDLDNTELPGTGTVYSYTVTHRAMHPEFEADVPYVLAYVRLDDGPMIVSWLREVDIATDLIDLRVRATFERIDDHTVLHRFVPVEPTG